MVPQQLMSKILMVAALTLVTSVGFVACGDDSSDSGEADAADQDAGPGTIDDQDITGGNGGFEAVLNGCVGAQQNPAFANFAGFCEELLTGAAAGQACVSIPSNPDPNEDCYCTECGVREFATENIYICYSTDCD